MSNNQNGFFAVSKSKFESAVCLGMNAAISYLVIACGTSKGNAESGWSVNAIERYTGISRGRAKKAVELLVDSGVIKRIKGGTKPKYRIVDGRTSKKLDPKLTCWLPNGIVMGVADEIPPLERIRQSQEIMLLVLFVDLYTEQNLLEDGGVSQFVCRTVYDREKINERAQFDVYGFSTKRTHLTWDTEIVKKHFRNENDLTQEELDAGANCTVDFFSRMESLRALGLIEKITHLVDHEDEGEIIHEINQELEFAARSAAEQLLSEHHDTDFEFLIPLDRHLKKATLVSTYRTIYRPRTKITGGWYQESQKRNARYLDKYNQIIETTSGGVL